MAATVAAAATLTLAPAALAEPAPVTGVELGTPVQKSVAVNARFDFTEAYTVGLPQLKKLRGEMWDQNVPFNKTTLRAAAAAHGLTTKEAYVNAVQIDPDLTRIAVQRAAEQPVNGVGHYRVAEGVNDWNTATIDGRRSLGENAAAGVDMAHAIYNSWGYGELAALKELKGEWGSTAGGNSDGHLHTLLNPENRYYGFGYVNVYPGGAYRDFVVAEVSHEALGGAALPEGTQNVNLYRPAKPGETPTGIQEYKERPRRDQQGANSGSSADVKSIIGIITAVISLLTVAYSFAHQMGWV